MANGGRNPESQRDLALSLISRRRSDPTAFRPPGGGMNPLQALEWLGREGIREPLSTAMSYASLSEADARANREGSPWWSRALSAVREPVDWFNADRWREASGIAQDRSLGQSTMLAPLTSNIRDPAEVAAAQESRLYRKGSGAVDLAARIFVDPNAVLGGATIRAMIANTARRGGPAAAAGIRSAAGQNRLGLQSPGRWLGRVDPPDAPPGSFGVPGRTSTTPQFNTPQYLDEIRAARPETITRTVPERWMSSHRSARSNHWRGAVMRRSPILEDGYIVPVGPGNVPEHGVLVQLDEAGQMVGKPLRAVGDRTPLDEIGLVGYDKPVSPNWITDSRRAGWWWVHADSLQPSSPHNRIIGLDDLESRAFKVALTGDEVAASKVDDLLERFDKILPDQEWDIRQVPATMEGGVFKGTAAEGRTLTEIGEMVANGQELQLAQGARREAYGVLDLDRLRRNSLPLEEAEAMWPTVRSMYVDEAVDNILTVRDDMDTMRLRALFYDDPSMAADQTAHSAIVDFVDRASYRSGTGDMGLPGWISIPTKESRLLEIRDLIVADLRAVTRKFVDDVGMPERVSVGRYQSAGERIGASGTTHPLDTQWGTIISNKGPFREPVPYGEFLGFPDPGYHLGTKGPGLGMSDKVWIEAVVDPRKDIDFFMLSRTGANFAEHEILMSPQTWAEKAVSGLGEHPTSWSSSQARQLTSLAPSDMPGMTPAQMEFGENAPKWLPTLLHELKAAGVEPDLIDRFIKAPAGAARERLANRVRSELSVGRRNVLEAEGWTNLPTSGAIRTYRPDGRVGPGGNLHVRDAFDEIASGKFDQADWFRFGTHQDLPIPPNWDEFMTQLSQEISTTLGTTVSGRIPTGALKAFKEWVNTGDPNATAQSLSGIVGWTVREGVTDPRASMELLPGWQHQLKRLVDDWYNNRRHLRQTRYGEFRKMS